MNAFALFLLSLLGVAAPPPPPPPVLWHTAYTYSQGIAFSLPIDGVKHQVIFDTGAEQFQIPAPVAARMHLKHDGDQLFIMANGSVALGWSTIITYTIGRRTVHARAGVLPGTSNGDILMGSQSLLDAGIAFEVDPITREVVFH